MANSKTVLFPIDIAYKTADDKVEIRKFSLALSLTLEEVGVQTSTCGEITINGAVMPVDDHPLVAVQPGDEVPPEVDGAKQGDDIQQAA